MKIVTYVISLFLFLNCLSFPQGNKVRLLFNNEGDIKNPSFFISANGSNSNSLLFEIHKDSTTNIYLSDYSAEKDSFLTPVPITDDNSLNINPMGFWTSIEKIIFFQTNINGKWGIAYRRYTDRMWGDVKIASDPNYDALNPSLVKPGSFYYNNSIVFQENNSIYLFTIKDSVETKEIIFKDSDSLQYSYPVGMYEHYYQIQNTLHLVIIVAAIESDDHQNLKLVKKIKSLDSDYDTTMVVDSGKISNPQLSSFYYPGLTYEKIENGEMSIYYNSVNGKDVNKLIINDTLDGSYSNLQLENCMRLLVDVFDKPLSIPSGFPYMYNLQRKNDYFVGVNKGFYTYSDTLIHVKINNSNSVIEYIGLNPKNYNRDINYAVWEDSSGGSIKLFGYKTETPDIDNIKEEKFLSNFILYQNYPNPFNPTTTIKYQIPNSGLVQLKVYDILGREVSMLVNEYQTAGEHLIEFNTQHTTNNKQLSSGIYFYQIRAGSYISTRKMILLK